MHYRNRGVAYRYEVIQASYEKSKSNRWKSYATEKYIFADSTNFTERLSFLIELFEKYRDDFDIVTELIESLGDSYRSITDKSKKATIENNHMNEMLLGKLKTIGYISSYREDDDKLRVSHKRNH